MDHFGPRGHCSHCFRGPIHIAVPIPWYTHHYPHPAQIDAVFVIVSLEVVVICDGCGGRYAMI